MVEISFELHNVFHARVYVIEKTKKPTCTVTIDWRIYSALILCTISLFLRVELCCFCPKTKIYGHAVETPVRTLTDLSLVQVLKKSGVTSSTKTYLKLESKLRTPHLYVALELSRSFIIVHLLIQNAFACSLHYIRCRTTMM